MKKVSCVAATLLALFVTSTGHAQNKVVIELSNPNTGQSVTVTVDHVEITPDGHWHIDCNPAGACMTPLGPLGGTAAASALDNTAVTTASADSLQGAVAAPQAAPKRKPGR